MKKNIILIMVLLLAVFFTLGGCTQSGSVKEPANAPISESTTAISNIDKLIDNQAADINSETNADQDLGGIKVNYSEKDKDSSYDESSATKITLSGSSASISGDGASVSGSIVTVSSAGTYILSGTLSDGQILVDTTKVDTVQLVLDGVHIANQTGCAIYVKQAEKVIITLAEKSKNIISDTTNYSDTGDKDPDSAIYAGDDLTINGSGSLAVYGNYKHAVKTVDDLVIVSGSLDITSVEEGLRGKDSVAIMGGNITIDSGGDAIKATNSDDEDSGWISIDGGTFEIKAENNGLEAQIGLIITSGQLSISSGQDTLHSNGSIRISGGNMNLAADDDGVHADNSLDITGGVITVSKSYEGLEASDITIRGGVISVSARDDGINAAGGSDGDMLPGDKFRVAASGNYFIAFSGGYTYVNAGGDGVDSNGSIDVSGGTLIVDGPESGANSAMDIENSGYIVSGGTLIAAGSVQMLITPTQATQPVVTIIFDNVQSGDSTVAVADSDGNILIAVSPDKAYQSLQISSPDFTIGNTYTLLYGGDISGESYDGTYYLADEFANSLNSAEFEISNSVMLISPDGQATQLTSIPGGGRGGPRGR